MHTKRAVILSQFASARLYTYLFRIGLKVEDPVLHLDHGISERFRDLAHIDDMFWRYDGLYLPVAVWRRDSSDYEWITPHHGFFVVNMFQFVSGKYSMERMDFKTTTDGHTHCEFVANIHFHDGDYSYSMPVGTTAVSWSLPSEKGGPYYSYVDQGDKYGDEYWTSTQYRFIADSTKERSGSFTVSSGGSINSLDDAGSRFIGVNHADMKYRYDLNRYVFDIRNEFTIPIATGR